jgi:hypothetical protein
MFNAKPVNPFPEYFASKVSILNTLRAKESAQKSQALQYQDFMQVGPIFLIRGGLPCRASLDWTADGRCPYKADITLERRTAG